MTKKSCHRGVALITVMLVVALAAILVTQMTGKLQLQMQRVSNIEANQQAYWYAMAAEALAKRVLISSFENEPNRTHLGQLWAQGESSYPVDNGQITGQITDLQSCFNLNALRAGNVSNTQSKPSSKTAKSSYILASEALERLILALNIEGVSSFEAKDMVDALTDWLDDDSQVTNNGGAEDNDYSSKTYPYLSANNFLGSVNELRLVEHFNITIINAIKPYVCVIPNTNLHQVNVNTLDEEHVDILSALLDIPQNIAEDILSGRGEEGYKKIDEVFTLPQLVKYKLTGEQKKQLVTNSDYFLLKTKATFNDSFFFLTSMMKIAKNNQIHIISRTIGRD